MSNSSLNDRTVKLISLLWSAAYEDFSAAQATALKEGIPFERDRILKFASIVCGDEVADLLEMQWPDITYENMHVPVVGIASDTSKVQSLAGELTHERELAEDALFEEWKAHRRSRAGDVVASFKALINALGQQVAIEVSTLAAALFQPTVIPGLAGAMRNQSTKSAEITEKFNWRLTTIQDSIDEHGSVRLTLATDFPTDESAKFVVLGVRTELLQKMKEAPVSSKLVVSDDIFELWSGEAQANVINRVEITFEMPKGMRIAEPNSHLHVPLQQDIQGVWGVILKVAS